MQELSSIAFRPDGTGHCLYSEVIELRELGHLECRRASWIEFDEAGQEWKVLQSVDVVDRSSYLRTCGVVQVELNLYVSTRPCRLVSPTPIGYI